MRVETRRIHAKGSDSLQASRILQEFVHVPFLGYSSGTRTASFWHVPLLRHEHVHWGHK